MDGVVRIGKAVDNSQVVREVDPRASREIWWLILLAAVLVGGLVLYAWPHLQLRQTASEAVELGRVRERLIEENRKLRLEKAALENLRRVETIAVRDLGLAPPPPERSIVVETPRPPAPGTRMAGARVAPAAAPAETPPRAAGEPN
jgi:cell division protein FtsL